MKKNRLITIVLAAVLIGAVAYWFLRPASPAGKSTITHDGLDVSVSYHRPYKKGRVIFGDATTGALQPYGQYWRLGANAATEISFSRDVTFGGHAVKQGTYRMYAVPGKDLWHVTLNSALGKSGSEMPDQRLDVVTADVVPAESTQEIEQFEIAFSPTDQGVRMELKWDRTIVGIDIQ